MPETLIWPVGLGMLGLIFGSFIATVAIRWPMERTVLSGRSACDGCGRVLSAHELVPLVAYVALRGRSACCRQRIAPIHPVCEAAGAAIGVVAGAVAPDTAGLVGAILGWQLLQLAALDWRALWLPNILTAALALSGLLLGEPAITDRLIGGVAGFASLWIVAAGYARWRGREGLGGGDPKLFGAIGLWLGWRALPAVLLLACAMGLAWALIGRLDRDARLPLGTLLALGGFALWIAATLSWP